MEQIDKLAHRNFLSICDVAMDILEETQMSSGNIVRIKLLANPIKFIELFGSMDSAGARDNYCETRYKATEYLKLNGHIADSKILEGLHHWDNVLEITLDKEKFNKFYEKLSDEYSKRYKEDKQGKMTEKEETDIENSENKVKSILLITPQYSNFDFFWIIFNHNYEKKHKVSMINKQTGNRDGIGNNLWLLCEEKKVDYDASFLNYMNDKIFKVLVFSEFSKTKLVQIKDNKILVNNGITLEKKSKELLDKDTQKYFS